MKVEMSYSTMTRLTDLLEEVRQKTDLIGMRPVNEYVDGTVRASGRHEYYCWHCHAEPASMHWDIKHRPECLLARIDTALAACLPERRSGDA